MASMGRGGGIGAAAVAWSGGKDSGLALLRARANGWPVTHLCTLYEAPTQRVRFHGVPITWIRAQGAALGLPVLLEAFEPGEPEHFDMAFQRLLERLADAGVDSLVFGNVHLADVRAWYEDRTSAAGFRHLEPLWMDDPLGLVREFLDRGGRTRVVSVLAGRGDPRWLGCELTRELLDRIAGSDRYDPCGEFGEYHTFMFDGPGFRAPLSPQFGGIVERDGHAMMRFESEPVDDETGHDTR